MTIKSFIYCIYTYTLYINNLMDIYLIKRKNLIVIVVLVLCPNTPIPKKIFNPHNKNGDIMLIFGLICIIVGTLELISVYKRFKRKE